MTTYLSAFALLLCLNAGAQDAITNRGTLQIHSGASVTAFGHFSNAATAAFTNNGTFYAKANIANDQASMAAGSGSLRLNGTSAQTISGAAPLKTYNLTTDNNAGIALTANVSVSGIHTFSAGLVTPAASNFLIYEAGASYTGNSDNRHVNGWVKKLGNTDFTFPVGSASIERAVSLTGLTATSEFNARYQAPTPNTSQMQGPIVNIDDNEYWAITKVSGGSASVLMNWNNSKVAFPNWQTSMIRAVQYNGSQWIEQGGAASGNTTTTGTLTSSSLSSFNLFTFGSRDFVLPLALISFDAKRMAGYTQLYWKTGNETAIHHFTIERSDNGRQFYNIGQQPARNTGSNETYTATDYKPVNGKTWYRLQSIALSGAQKTSPVVSITEDTENTVSLLTNPVRSQLVLRTSLRSSNNFHYQIHNAGGSLVQEGILWLQRAGLSAIAIKSPAAGLYTISLYNGSQRFYLKFQIR